MNRHKSKTAKKQKRLFNAWLRYMDTEGRERYKFKPLKIVKVYRRDEGIEYPSAEPSKIVSISRKRAPKYEGEMLEREQKAQEEIAKKKTRVAPLHKSNYIYISDGIDPAGLGRKNEVL
jgi:hypothetical protein